MSVQLPLCSVPAGRKLRRAPFCPRGVLRHQPWSWFLTSFLASYSTNTKGLRPALHHFPKSPSLLCQKLQHSSNTELCPSPWRMLRALQHTAPLQLLHIDFLPAEAGFRNSGPCCMLLCVTPSSWHRAWSTGSWYSCLTVSIFACHCTM